LFLTKIFLQAKEPHEFAQIQTEFLSRQAEAIIEETKQFGQTLVNGAEELANISLRQAEELTRAQSKAA